MPFSCFEACFMVKLVMVRSFTSPPMLWKPLEYEILQDISKLLLQEFIFM